MVTVTLELKEFVFYAPSHPFLWSDIGHDVMGMGNKALCFLHTNNLYMDLGGEGQTLGYLMRTYRVVLSLMSSSYLLPYYCTIMEN